MKTYPIFLIIIFLGLSTVSAQNNSSKDPYLPIVDLLEVGEQYEIAIRSAGCFHNRQQSLFILREENSFVALLNDTEVILDKSQMAALRRFEIQLKNIIPAGCTTIDTYILEFGPEMKIYNDDTCSNFFGKTLIKELGFSS